MKFPRSLGRGSLCLLVCLLALAATSPRALAFGEDWKDWRPVDPAQLALKSPTVEKDADAEALFWEVKVADVGSDGAPRTVLEHYIRIKVFTERGRESQSKVDILAQKVGNREIKITDVAGRTIKPDGTIVELKKEDVFERTIIRTSGLKLKAKSFSMPGVEPGAIIEYRWRETRGDSFSNYDRLEFSRDIPVQSVKYYIRPSDNRYLAAAGIGMRVQFFKVEGAPFKKEKDGFYSITQSNVPAYHEEPNSPPEYSVRPWMLIYYTEDKKLSAAAFWKDYGKQTYEEGRSNIKVNDDVKRKAAELVGDATTPDQKIERIFEFCRTQIKDAFDDANGMTAEQREKVKENKSPADTLKRGIGNGYDIDMLFAALATAAGFEARVAHLADRGDTFFDATFPDSYFMRAYDIAVRVGDEWRFFDPASAYVPYGMLRWQEEGQSALLSDPKEPTFVKTPISGPEKSVEKRTANLKLADDGTLEGDVRLEYTGHIAAGMKEAYDDDSPTEREEALKDRFKSQMAGIEITDIKIENVTDPVKPFVYAFHVKVAGYAQRTGKRLFIQPAFFQHGASALFSTSDRKNEVYFHYSWSEEDRVEITLPEGFALDNAESPAPFASGKITGYEPHAAVTKDGRTLVYTRKFFFDPRSQGSVAIFPTTSYPQLKALFDQLHTQDNHTISLKQGAPPSAAAKSSN
ncbi:MAG: DUF3857 domain-containing protein [Pyrinomonadaceae bacterium]